MGEWSTYSLDDFLMFSPSAWYRLLEMHHRAWWPLQIGVALLGTALAWALHRRLRPGLRLALVLTGVGLVFVGWAFHGGSHADINLAAPYFAYGFAAQGLLLIALALLRPELVLARSNGTTRLACALLVCAWLLYPVLAPLWARPWAQAEWFALAPDPTMLAALAVVLLVHSGSHGLRHPHRTCIMLSVLPLAWCAATGATAWALGDPGWWQMPVAALLVCAAIGWHALRHTAPTAGTGARRPHPEADPDAARG